MAPQSKNSEVLDPEELIEELLNGPYFGDEREHGHTNVRILKNHCILRDNEEHESARGPPSSSPEADPKKTMVKASTHVEAEAAGTTAYVRGGLCLRDRVDIVKRIRASYWQRSGLKSMCKMTERSSRALTMLTLRIERLT